MERGRWCYLSLRGEKGDLIGRRNEGRTTKGIQTEKGKERGGMKTIQKEGGKVGETKEFAQREQSFSLSDSDCDIQVQLINTSLFRHGKKWKACIFCANPPHTTACKSNYEPFILFPGTQSMPRWEFQCSHLTGLDFWAADPCETPRRAKSCSLREPPSTPQSLRKPCRQFLQTR